MLVCRQSDKLIANPQGPPHLAQVEVWTADDFPKDPPADCGLTPEQYQDLIDK
ncbi:TPA: hypothetical protein ACH3X3_005738 [Trebouxia sp. C0006]